jgi:hypothetical protein
MRVNGEIPVMSMKGRDKQSSGLTTCRIRETDECIRSMCFVDAVNLFRKQGLIVRVVEVEGMFFTPSPSSDGGGGGG